MSIIVFLFFIIIIFYTSSIKKVNVLEVFIVERFGKYHRTLLPGINIICPFVDKVRSTISMTQQTMNIPPQGIITNDNKTIMMSCVVVFHVTDPLKATYAVDSLHRGIQYVVITTMRNVVGRINADNIDDSKDSITLKIYDELNLSADKWGCKIESVENVEITNSISTKHTLNDFQDELYGSNTDLQNNISAEYNETIKEYNSENDNPIIRY